MLSVTKAQASRHGGNAPFQELPNNLAGTAMRVQFTPTKRPLIGHVPTNDEAIRGLERVRDALPKWRGTWEIEFRLWVRQSPVVQVLAEGRVYRGEVEGAEMVGGQVAES